MNEEAESVLNKATELINNVTTALLANTNNASQGGSQGNYNNTSLGQERAIDDYNNTASNTCYDLKLQATKIALCYAVQVQCIYCMAANTVALQNAADRLNQIRGLSNINCYTIACGSCFSGGTYWK